MMSISNHVDDTPMALSPRLQAHGLLATPNAPKPAQRRPLAECRRQRDATVRNDVSGSAVLIHWKTAPQGAFADAATSNQSAVSHKTVFHF